MLDLDKQTEEDLPPLISAHIMPTLTLRFGGDLSKGAMFVIRYVPLGGKARRHGLRKSHVELLLDGKKAGTLIDIATGATMCDGEFVRYVEIPPVGDAARHELTLTTPRGTGTELYCLWLYTPGKQDLYPSPQRHVDPYAWRFP